MSLIKELLKFSKQDEARLSSQDGVSTGVFVVQTPANPSETEKEIAEEQESTSKHPSSMKAPHTFTPVVLTYMESSVAVGIPIAGVSSTSEDLIVISDKSADWKNSSETSAKAT